MNQFYQILDGMTCSFHCKFQLCPLNQMYQITDWWPFLVRGPPFFFQSRPFNANESICLDYFYLTYPLTAFVRKIIRFSNSFFHMYFYNNSAFWFQNIPLLKRIPFIENFLFFEIRASLSWLWSLLRFIYFHSNAQYKLCYLYNINCSNIFSDNWVTINLTHCLVHFEVEVSFGSVSHKSKFNHFSSKMYM